MRIAVFGAGGPTGGQLITQALAAGHDVTAVTRRPDRLPRRDRLDVARADVADTDATADAIAGADAVASAVGVSYRRAPISTYSTAAASIIAGMRRHGAKRLVVVSSAPLDPGYRPSGSFFYTRILDPLFMRRPGATTYADMERMETLVRGSDLDWTIVRSAWLFDAPAVSDYSVAERSASGLFTARPDLAACMLRQLTDTGWLHTPIGVATTTGTPSLPAQIWREGIRRPTVR
jgi:putative NADH-flavin reductase